MNSNISNGCEPTLDFQVLRNRYLNWRIDMNYSKGTISHDELIYQRFIDYAKINSYEAYSLQLGNDFFEYASTLPFSKKYIARHRLMVYRLNCILLSQEIGIKAPRVRLCVPDVFKKAYQLFLAFCNTKGNSTATISMRARYASRFFNILYNNGYRSYDAITPEIVLKMTLNPQLKPDYSSLKQLLKWLYDNNFVDKNYSFLVPSNTQKHRIPDIYTKEEILSLECTFNRHTPKGKRDYAMTLLATRLRLRRSDITGLLLESLDFTKDTIQIIQVKTGNPLNLPMTNEVKLALQDYVENGRPTSEEPYVFLRVKAPYVKLGSHCLYEIVSQAFADAQINTENKRHGPHSLRASGASHMINSDVPYSIVSQSLGHRDKNIIQKYARLDLAQLRKCAISPPTVTRNSFFESFLKGEEVL